MKKKKILIPCVIAAAAAIVIGGLLLFRGRGGENGGDSGDPYVTREQWISMLAQGFGMDTHQSEDPFYSDIPADHRLFHQVQASAEWRVLSIYSGDRLEPEKKVTCEEVASTASIAAGFSVEDGPGGREGFDSGPSVEHAVQNGIVDSEKKLSDPMTARECEEALQRAKELYLRRTGEEEKAIFKMKGRVLDLRDLPQDSFRINQTNGDVEYITFSPGSAVFGPGPGEAVITVFAPGGPVELRENDVVILNHSPRYPTGAAYKVTLIQEAAGMAVFIPQTPDLSDIYEEIELHAIRSADFNNIIWENGITVSTAGISGTGAEGEYQVLPLTAHAGVDAFALGLDRTFTIELSRGETPSDGPSVSFGPGVGAGLLGQAKYKHAQTPSIEEFLENGPDTWERKLEREKEQSTGFTITGTITFHALEVTADVVYHQPLLPWPGPSFPESVSLQLDSQIDADLVVKGNLREKQKIGTLPVTLPVPGLTVDVELYLVTDLSGRVTLEASLGGSTKVQWEGGKLKRATQNKLEVGGGVAVDLDLGLNLSGTLTAFAMIDIIDLEAEVTGRVTVSATEIGRRTETTEGSVVTRHYSVSVRLKTDFYAPIVKLRAANDGTLCHVIMNGGIEWILRDADSGAKSWNLFDDEWVVWEQTVVLGEGGEARPVTNTYTTRFAGFPTFEFDYPGGWSVVGETLDATNEQVTLQNSRGVQVRYSKDGSGMATGSLPIAIERIGRSDLRVAGVDHAPFVVAQVRLIDADMDDGGVISGYYVNTDQTYFALLSLPEQPVPTGMEEMVRGDFSELASVADSLSFPTMIDGSWVGFAASSPDGQFTPEEEAEVIAILRSFREKAGA